MKKVSFTKKNNIRLFNKSDYPTNYVTHPQHYQTMYGEMTDAGREVENGMNSPMTQQMTRKLANKWSPETAKQKAIELASVMYPILKHNKKRKATKGKKTKKAKKAKKSKKSKKTHGHK